jgi:hypothetical protein
MAFPKLLGTSFERAVFFQEPFAFEGHQLFHSSMIRVEPGVVSEQIFVSG